MNPIDVILKNEVQNKNGIILSEFLGGWRAYEQSAFHFAHVFKMGKIQISNNNIFIEVGNELEFLHSEAMSLVRIEAVADNEIKIECDQAFSDFAHWRSKTMDELN